MREIWWFPRRSSVRTSRRYNRLDSSLTSVFCFFSPSSRNFPIIEPTTEPIIKEESLEFLESSWCNRNAQWSTYVFTGPKIDRPLQEMATAAEWRDDLRSAIEAKQKTVYLVTVPRLYGTDETPKTFFYNTHFFTLQLLFDSTEEGLVPRFKIFAGFARHYRMIDYLQDWDANAEIEDNHRLKINRTTWAVDSFGEQAMFDDFLANLEVMMDDINDNMAWTRKANDIHADLFYADKFKDMIFLQSNGLKKPRQEKAKRYKFASLRSMAPPSDLAEMKDGSKIEFGTTTINDVATPDSEIPRLDLNKVPADGFYVPLAIPSTVKYILTIRKYHYTDSACEANASKIKRTCYPRDQKHWKPALPFQMTPESYGTYQERESIPKSNKASQTVQ